MSEMRVGVCILPDARWREAGDRWRRAEALGFDHAWTYDHLAWRSLRDEPWFSAIPTLTAAAAVTDTIRLGTLVASPNFRHPVPFARELSTLDDLSNGRLIAGLGAGGEGWDATVLGQAAWSSAERSARFVEFTEMLDRLLRDPVTDHVGQFWSADGARNAPGCLQQPRVPFAIAAMGPQGMRLTARHASIWITNGDRQPGPPLPATEGAALVAKQIARLDAVCEAEGRDPSTLGRLVLAGLRLDGGLASRVLFEATKEAYAAVGVTDLVVHWPRTGEPYAGDPELLDRLMT